MEKGTKRSKVMEKGVRNNKWQKGKYQRKGGRGGPKKIIIIMVRRRCWRTCAVRKIEKEKGKKVICGRPGTGLTLGEPIIIFLFPFLASVLFFLQSTSFPPVSLVFLFSSPTCCPIFILLSIFLLLTLLIASSVFLRFPFFALLPLPQFRVFLSYFSSSFFFLFFLFFTYSFSSSRLPTHSSFSIPSYHYTNPILMFYPL